jgi:hypothetical protein
MAQVTITDDVLNEGLEAVKTTCTKVKLYYSSSTTTTAKTVYWGNISGGELLQYTDDVVSINFTIDTTDGAINVTGFALYDDATTPVEQIQYVDDNVYAYPNNGIFKISGMKVVIE